MYSIKICLISCYTIWWSLFATCNVCYMCGIYGMQQLLLVTRWCSYKMEGKDITVYCLLFAMKTFCIFRGLLLNFKSIWVTWILWKLVKAGNHERFSWNKGKDVKQWMFFSRNDNFVIFMVFKSTAKVFPWKLSYICS